MWCEGVIMQERQNSFRIVPTGRVYFKDPITSDDQYYSDEQKEFIFAMDALKRKLKRMPTYQEVLAEAKQLGYEK
jgi:hypothetical protein